MNRAAWAQGLRNVLPEGVNRHEVKEAHGYRKFFKTRAEDGGMKTLNVEFLMGHNNGLQRSYYKPPEQQLLDDYLKAVPSLTINYDNYDKSALQKQVAELTEKSEEANYIIKGKLAEKEKEAEETKKRLEELAAKQEILQANNASLFRALLDRDDFGVKTPATIITWRANEGSEGLFEAAALAREENQKREKEHQQKHHELNQRYQQHRQKQLQQEKEIEDSKLNSKL